MSRKIVGIVAIVSLLGIAGCSQQNQQNFLHNISAADCHDPTQTVADFQNSQLVASPQITAQLTAAVTELCDGIYGPVAAPTPAPGNNSALPAVPAATANPAAVSH